MNSACVEGNAYSLPPSHHMSHCRPYTTAHSHSFWRLSPRRARTLHPLRLPVRLGLAFSGGTRCVQLCPAVPAAASPPEPALRAPRAGVPGRWHSGSAGLAGSEEGASANARFVSGREAKGALGARAVSGSCWQRARVAEGKPRRAAGTACGGGEAGGCRVRPSRGEAGLASEHMHCHGNSSWKENLKRTYYPQGEISASRGEYMCILQLLLVLLGIMCVNPRIPARKYESVPVRVWNTDLNEAWLLGNA